MPSFERFLELDEARLVIEDLHRRAKRSRISHLNLIVFRLACGCGLRRGEIAGLKFTDLVLAGPRPLLLVRKDNTKGREGKRRARKVPLNWDRSTLEDIRNWVDLRRSMGAQPDDPVLCGLTKRNWAKPLTPSMVAKHWKTAIRCLGPERVRQLSVHTGRHSYSSFALSAGHSLVELRDALGHANISTTSVYAHSVPTECRDLFADREAAPCAAHETDSPASVGPTIPFQTVISPRFSSRRILRLIEPRSRPVSL
jgi:integrase